jgi:hypothetical protein
MTEAPKKIVVDVAGAMDKITPEFIEMMAPLLTQPMIASLENENARLRARVSELEAANRGLVRLNEATQARAEAAEAQVAALTAKLATAREDALDAAAAAVRQALVDASFNYRNNKVLSSAMFKAELHATNAIRTLANEAKP